MTRGELKDRVDSRCPRCGSVYLDCSLPSAQKMHDSDEPCRGTLALLADSDPCAVGTLALLPDSSANAPLQSSINNQQSAIPMTPITIPNPNMSLHMPVLEEYASNAKCIIELGCQYGAGSTLAFCRGIVRSGRYSTHISVDIKDQLHPLLRPMIPFWHLVLGDTRFPKTRDDVQSILGGCAYECDLLFIDTVHEKKFLAAELDNWFPLLADDCIMLFHDTHMGGKFNPMTEAITDFAAKYKNWRYVQLTTECDGLGALLPNIV